MSCSEAGNFVIWEQFLYRGELTLRENFRMGSQTP